MKLLYLFIITNFILLKLVISQKPNIDSIILRSNQIIIENDPVFQISELTYYKAEVLKKMKFKNGFLTLFNLSISDSNYAYIYVVSGNEKTKKSKEKLKVGKVYYIQLIDYFDHFLTLSIEHKEVYDVMLGNNKISILSGVQDAIFSKIFVSPNIFDLYYVDSITVQQNKAEVNLVYENLYSTICSFIKSITYSKYQSNLINYVDTNELKKSISQFSLTPIKSSLSFKYDTSNNKSLFNNNPLPQNLSYLNWSNFGINEQYFDSLFWGMLRIYYTFPVTYNENYIDISCNNLIVKSLYYCDDIITVQVKWKIESQYEYIAILSLKRLNDVFKVIGFNQPTDAQEHINMIYNKNRRI